MLLNKVYRQEINESVLIYTLPTIFTYSQDIITSWYFLRDMSATKWRVVPPPPRIEELVFILFKITHIPQFVFYCIRCELNSSVGIVPLM